MYICILLHKQDLSFALSILYYFSFSSNYSNYFFYSRLAEDGLKHGTGWGRSFWLVYCSDVTCSHMYNGEHPWTGGKRVDQPGRDQCGVCPS